MKNIFKKTMILLLSLIHFCSFSQTKYKEQKALKEIKLIFKDEKNQLKSWPLYLDENETLNLPPYFTNYKEYIDKRNYLNNQETWLNFDPSSAHNYGLNNSDFEEINKLIVSDTNRMFIEKTWFGKTKINILSDSVLKSRSYNTRYMKPIFFRNYNRCFIAIIYKNSMDSFFLKKKKNHWVFDAFYQRYEID